ncbi:MAG: C10 family peptidase, partial [Muribaculaceae bacterium]|nr:C10 family peptidase [Muribaculaceae bacterium]
MTIPHIKILRSALLSLTVVSGVMSGLAAPVDPAAARAEAADFLSRPQNGRKALPANPPLTLAYTSETAEKTPTFYIFNHDEGFVIISADDRLPAVLGYSDNGAFDESHVPDNFRWWLEEYTGEISAWLPTATETLPVSRKRHAPVNRQAIAPMTETTWDQNAPYNDDCPIDKAGYRSVTGCVATAMAQLMKFHEWPAQPKGSSGGIDFNGTTYDWNLMLDHYEDGEYTPAQAAAVAKLMRQCGAAVNMQYSSWSSGAYDNAVPYAFVNYFKYNPEMQLVWKIYTPQAEWNDLVYNELAAGRPVYYSGSSDEGGHAFICDGYSQNEYFHINWGWGGYQDGYFLLTALNPASGGAGSYEGGYNSGQIILTGLSPNRSGATAGEQLALVSTGGFFYDLKDSVYYINEDPKGYNLMYNPLVYDETLIIGLKFTDLGNPDAAPLYSIAGSVTLEPQYGIGEMSCQTPELPDGIYSITPVFSESEDNWRPVLIPLGKQNYVRLTVADQRYSYENLGPDASTKAQLIVNMPLTTPVIYGNADMAFRLPVLNVGQGDFTGRLGLTLVPEDNPSAGSVSGMVSVPVPGKAYTEVDFAFSEQLRPGTYLMYIGDESNNMFIDGVEVKVEEGKFPPVKTIGDVLITDLTPNFVTSEKANPIYFTIDSSSAYDERVNFNISVLDARTLAKVKDLNCRYSVVVAPGFLGRITVP